MFRSVSKSHLDPTRFTGAVAIVALVALTGCGEMAGGPEADAVSALKKQGFKIASDGRLSDASTAMWYTGGPAGVITCSGSGNSAAVASGQTASVDTESGLKGHQSGHVDAYVIVGNDGSLRGLYHNRITREVRTASGDVVGREVEVVKFPPGGKGRFRDGVECRANL